MDEQRRAYIMAKYQALNNPRPMAPHANTQVRATDRAERIVEQVWRWMWQGEQPFDPATVLFDPARVPALAERADAAAAEFHRREGEASRERALGSPPSFHYDTSDGPDAEYDPDAPAEQGVAKVWRVGSKYVDVVRERWRDAPNRTWGTTDYFAHLFEFLVDQLDYHDCTKFGCDGDCDLKCNTHIAKACSGTTRLLPVNRGTLVLLFRCCEACEELAGKIAANTYRTNVKIAGLEARDDWPPDPQP